MPHPIEPSTLRILKPTGETVGTGFLVSKHLAVTCAHVVKILGAGCYSLARLGPPTGRGKSAVFVRCLDSLKTREYLSLAFVLVSIRFGTNMERVFYAALAARLAFLRGDDVPASPETATAVYRGLVSKLSLQTARQRADAAGGAGRPG